jgi:hypothetical protein
MGRKCGTLGEQEQEREGRATSWTSKSIAGGTATPWASVMRKKHFTIPTGGDMIH